MEKTPPSCAFICHTTFALSEFSKTKVGAGFESVLLLAGISFLANPIARYLPAPQKHIALISFVPPRIAYRQVLPFFRLRSITYADFVFAP